MGLIELWYDILEHLFKKQIRVYHVYIEKKDVRFFPGDIIRIEAEGSYCSIITTERSYLISRNLKYVEQTIHGWGFIRINRAHIINIAHLREIDMEKALIVMTDGVIIRIPRRKREKVISDLIRKKDRS